MRDEGDYAFVRACGATLSACRAGILAGTGMTSTAQRAGALPTNHVGVRGDLVHRDLARDRSQAVPVRAPQRAFPCFSLAGSRFLLTRLPD